MMEFILVTILLLVQPLKSHCPCKTEALCQPVSLVPSQEVFAFMNDCDQKIWKTFDWNKLTTLAVSDCYDSELVCLAHQHNVRVVLFGTYPGNYLLNKTKRVEWIEEKLSLVQEHHMDGFNIDFESEIPRSGPESAGLTALARETTHMFHDAVPCSQVTFDVAWSPTGIDGRWYDYLSLSQVVDFLFVMAYDEQSQIFDTYCTARANSGLQKTEEGLTKYMDLGIPAAKLVLGVPWYGYNYECINLAENQTCFIKEVPFRTANCSDAAGRQVQYSTIVEKFLPNATSGQMWDPQQQSPYFNFKDEATGHSHQMWYDDPQSLKKKYELASRYSLRGVGMWAAEHVDYSNTTVGEKQRAKMWGALPTPVKLRYEVLHV